MLLLMRVLKSGSFIIVWSFSFDLIGGWPDFCFTYDLNSSLSTSNDIRTYKFVSFSKELIFRAFNPSTCSRGSLSVHFYFSMFFGFAVFLVEIWNARAMPRKWSFNVNMLGDVILFHVFLASRLQLGVRKWVIWY